MKNGDLEVNINNRALPAMALWLGLAACSNVQPLATVDDVDLDRFMGDWYVIANIPTTIEKGAHNAVESYRRNADGTIKTTFTFRDGAFDGKRKTYHPRGFVSSESDAIWNMQFVWPFRADYRIAHLEHDYSVTIIGRNKRDYVWLMARDSQMPEAQYQQMVNLIESMGYDTTLLQRVPQQW
jgi:apolipoprotein D and lipocalin family protein